VSSSIINRVDCLVSSTSWRSVANGSLASLLPAEYRFHGTTQNRAGWCITLMQNDHTRARCLAFPQAMCHCDDKAAETVLTVCRSLLNAHHCNLSFQKPKHIQFHIHSRTSVHRVTHSHVLIALATVRRRPSAPLLYQSLGNIPSLSLAYGPSITDTNITIGEF
jgi:hypothetical protein